MTETKKNPIGRFIENTLVPISTAFAQNRYVRCIGTGSQNLMAIIMIGAVFNLLNSIQIDPYQSFIQATGIAAFLNAVGCTSKTLVVTANADQNVVRSGRNIEGCEVTFANLLNTYDVLHADKLVVDKAALQKIQEVFA